MKKTILLFSLIALNLCLTAQDSLFTWNREITVISGVIRRASTGWQFVTPQHEKLGFSGTITATSSQLTLDMDFDGFGLDPAQWYPSGFVVTPDETFSVDGASFGASVGSTSVVIRGTNGIIPQQQIAWNGTNWVGIGGYTASWITTANAQCLQLDRNVSDNSAYRQGQQVGGIPTVILQNNAVGGALYYNLSLDQNISSNTTNRIRVGFFNNGTRVTTPDTNMKFWLTDYTRKCQAFDFTTNITNLSSSANIWIVGTFVKALTPAAMQMGESENTLTAYPNPSNGQFKLSTTSTSPIKVYSMSGEIIYLGTVENCILDRGMYIVEQDSLRTKVVIN
jgi:hypothetical protein